MASKLTNGQLIIKLEKLLEAGEITNEAATILLLESMHGVLTCLSDLKEVLSEVKTTQDDNPSLVWYARNQSKRFITIMGGFLVMLLFLHDWRDAILSWIQDVLKAVF